MMSVISPSIPSIKLFEAPKTTIILSELPKEVFVKSRTTNLSIADQIKLLVLNRPHEYSSIRYFSVLSLLQRIVIVCTEESTAKDVFHAIKFSGKFGSFKANLSSTLINLDPKHVLEVENVQKMEYEENIPRPSPEIYKAESSTKTLLKSMSLSIDTSVQGSSGCSPVSPEITLDSYEL